MEFQEIMKNLKSVFSTVANKTAEKSSEIFDRTKISLNINSIKSSIDKDYKEIGKLIYEGYKKDELDSEKVSEICKSIDAKKEEINALKVKVAEYKEYILCPKCGAEIMPESEFCAKCGERL